MRPIEVVKVTKKNAWWGMWLRKSEKGRNIARVGLASEQEDISYETKF